MCILGMKLLSASWVYLQCVHVIGRALYTCKWVCSLYMRLKRALYTWDAGVHSVRVLGCKCTLCTWLYIGTRRWCYIIHGCWFVQSWVIISGEEMPRTPLTHSLGFTSNFLYHIMHQNAHSKLQLIYITSKP